MRGEARGGAVKGSLTTFSSGKKKAKGFGSKRDFYKKKKKKNFSGMSRGPRGG